MDTLIKIKHWMNMQSLKVFSVVVKLPKPDTFIGADSSLQLCRMLSSYKVSHVLIVTDEILRQLNLMQHCVKELERNGIKVSVYSGVSPNPTEQQIRHGMKMAVDDGCDGVIGFGGGSPMDAAKVIAAGAMRNMDVREMEGAFKIKKRGLPLFAIPTTAGTGSETTFVAMISCPEESRKYPVVDSALVPIAVALDHQLMLGLPPNITAETGMDVLTHAVEAYIATCTNKEAQAAAIIATQLVFKHLRSAYEDGGNVEAREGMAFASFKGGEAISVGVGYVHGIAHQLGGMYHIPHGLANAIILPHILEFSVDKAEQPLAELAEAIDLNTAGKSQREKAMMFIEAVKELSTALGIPEGLTEIEADDIPTIYQAAHQETMNGYGAPKYLPKDTGEALISALMLK